MNGKKWQSIIGIVGIASLFGIAYYFKLDTYLSLEWLKEKRLYFMSLVVAYPYVSALVYIGISALIIASGVPAIAPLTLMSGFLFGFVYGTFYVLIAALVGSVILFLFIRYVLTATIRRTYGTKLETFNARFADYGYSYLLTMHWMTVIPYFVIISFAALAAVPLYTFIWTTLVGSFPSIIIYALAGRQLGMISSFSDIFSPQIIIAFLLLAFLSIVPMIVCRVREITDI